MRISSNGVSLIKQFEGLSLTAYWDVDAYSIGYGHHSKVIQKGAKITEAEAEVFLKNDLERFEKHVNSYNDKYHFTQYEFDALVSFAYNIGSINLLTDYGRRSKELIAAKMPLYCKAGGVVLRSLQRRRQAEQALFLKKDKPSDFYPAYTGESANLDEILAAIGADSDFDVSTTKLYKKRYPIAKANGLEKYSGTYAQNMKLINLARTGELRRVNND